MRQTRPGPTPSFASNTPPPWMKAIFVVEASIFLLALLLISEQLESAQAELGNMQKQLKAKSDECDNMRREQENNLAYLGKYENDPEFKKREARQRLGFVEPGEVVFRLDPQDAKSAAK